MAFEQSYMPMMLEMNAYDTICHEHLEFYSLSVVKKLLKFDLKIVDVEINDVNGGSFAVTACHKKCNDFKANTNNINSILEKEKFLKIGKIEKYKEFEKR